MVEDRLNDIWLKMDESERWGCKYGLFPIWVEEQQLPKPLLDELRAMSEGGARYPEQERKEK